MIIQGVSVESVDDVFQTKMLDMLKQTGRPEMVVGWYHSHPGFGCWLSSVDVNTQQVNLLFRFHFEKKKGILIIVFLNSLLNNLIVEQLQLLLTLFNLSKVK